MKDLKKYLPIAILIIAILIGVFFRFYKIGQSPSGFYVDEAALGYNSYSILKTGKDEFGKSFPVMFRSFATFQSPVYTYLTIPFIQILGLTPLAVRFPSAFFGVLTIPLLYFLVKKISPEKYTRKLALISAFLLSISPWHIMYSRTAYETNIALFFLLLGSLFFYYSISKSRYLIISVLSLAISFNAYRAETLIVPILGIVLLVRFRKAFLSLLKSHVTTIIPSILLGLVLVLPMVLIMRTPGFQARTSSLNIFSFSRQLPWGYQDSIGSIQKIINNPLQLSIKEFSALYTSYFSPRYLFSLGDAGPRKPFPDLATFFVWQFPLYLIGLYFLLKDKQTNKLKTFVFTLLLVSPIPAALTRDPYSTLRSLPMVVPLIIIMSFGLVKVLEYRWSLLNKFKYLIICLFVLYSSVGMYVSIFHLNDYFRSIYWDYGWQGTVESFKSLDQNLPIVVDNSRGDIYILLLFFLKYNPSLYQKNNSEVPLSEYYTNMTRNPIKHLGKITVKSFTWGTDTDNIEQYIVADNLAISQVQINEHHMVIIKEIKHPNGDIALRILKTNPNHK